MAYDDWAIEKELGGGGQGTTYLVRHTKSEQMGVMKLLHPDVENPDRARARMKREVANLQLVAANGGEVPWIHDDFIEDQDHSGFVMDLVDGVTLDKFIEGRGPIPLSEAVELVRRLGDTIAAGHADGVGHRDLKPENIMATTHGDRSHLRPLDYGLSFSEDDSPDTEFDETIRNQFLHLPELLVVGDGRRHLTSDVSCLAGILLFLLNGGVPPRSLTDGEGRAPHLREETAPKVELTDNERRLLNAVLARAFAGPISDRFQTVGELLERLDHVLEVGAVNDEDVNLVELMASESDRIVDTNAALAAKLRLDKARTVAKDLAAIVTRLAGSTAGGHFSSKVDDRTGTTNPPFDDSLDCPYLTVSTTHVHTKRSYRTTYAFRSPDGVEIRVSRQSGHFPEGGDWEDVCYFAVDEDLDEAREALIADVKRQQVAGVRAISELEADDPTEPDLDAEAKQRRIARSYNEPS